MSAANNKRPTVNPGILKSKHVDGTIQVGDRITEDEGYRVTEADTTPSSPAYQRCTEDQ